MTSPQRAATAATKTAATPSGCSNFKLRQVARLATRHFESHVAPLGLKITQYSLLSHVLHLGPLRTGELAAAMQLSPSALSRNLRPLLAQGWLEVAAGADARSRVVAITAAGREQRGKAQRAWKRAQLDFNQRLGVERVARLHQLLDECIGLLGQVEGRHDD